jgi:hypothetical protein
MRTSRGTRIVQRIVYTTHKGVPIKLFCLTDGFWEVEANGIIDGWFKDEHDAYLRALEIIGEVTQPEKTSVTLRYGRLEINLSFLWYDFWVGFFWDRKKCILYVNPLPCVVFRFRKVGQ